METIFKATYEVKYKGNKDMNGDKPIRTLKEYQVDNTKDLDNLMGSLMRMAKTEIGYNDYSDDVKIKISPCKVVYKNKLTKMEIVVKFK